MIRWLVHFLALVSTLLARCSYPYIILGSRVRGEGFLLEHVGVLRIHGRPEKPGEGCNYATSCISKSQRYSSLIAYISDPPLHARSTLASKGIRRQFRPSVAGVVHSEEM
jgi:hypothetical protein